MARRNVEAVKWVFLKEVTQLPLLPRSNWRCRPSVTEPGTLEQIKILTGRENVCHQEVNGVFRADDGICR